MHEVTLNLTEDAPVGLNGIARVFLLREAGKLVGEAKVEHDDYDDEQEDLRNYVRQRFGYIQHIHVDRTIKEGITEGYSVEVGSQGRWTQQGFWVPYPIFPAHYRYGETWGVL